MSNVISLDQHRAARRRRAASVPPTRVRPAQATLYFDLSSPDTYLAAERADRMFAGLSWQPASAASLYRRGTLTDGQRDCAAQRAAQLRLPLVWPDDECSLVPAAMRVAALAAERGRGAQFVLAASRLAFCGGFDIDDPEILAEAVAAAGLPFDDSLRAAGDAGRDAAIEDAGLRLLSAGADCLPVLRVGRTIFCGEQRLNEASAFSRNALATRATAV